MSTTEWIYFFLIANLLHGAATWKFYKKAGIDVWKAFVPFLNMYELMNIINRPKWWMVFVYIPIVNLLMMPVLWAQTISVFGKKKDNDKWLAVLTFGLYPAYVNYVEADKLTYNPERLNSKDTLTGSLIFAVIAATIVHTYFIQPYTIPTGSLEKSLLIGDYLFVSKFHYGARTPMTTISLPMVHDTIPLVGDRSYSKFPQLPYFRLPGLQKVKRFDIVVFNWPADTVKHFFQHDAAQYKPIDKKSHYVKRCVGIPGDMLEIKNGVLYVNDQKAVYPDRTFLQHLYEVYTKDGQNFTRSSLLRLTDSYGIKEIGRLTKTAYIMNLTDEQLKGVKSLSNVKEVKLYDTGKGSMFYGYKKDWDINNYGKIYIPKEGDVVKLNKETYPFYKRIIETYDNHDKEHRLRSHKVTLQGEQVYIDGKPTDSYTIKQDYYWMMGDNRSESEDSRFWGFVPADHIVGKPVFIFFSKGADGIRWDRVFTTVSGDGKRVSYLIPFFVLLGLYYFGSKYYNKKKKAA